MSIKLMLLVLGHVEGKAGENMRQAVYDVRIQT
jgi:hypothetical protein